MPAWLSSHYTEIMTALASIASAIAAVDRMLAKSEKFLHNDFFSFAWAGITRRPIKAATKGDLPMNTAFLDRLESILDKLCKIVEFAAPIAAAIAPATGASAPAVAAAATAANTIATATDQAISVHEAVNSPESAVAAMAHIALAVAESGVVNPDIAAKIKTATTALPDNLFTP